MEVAGGVYTVALHSGITVQASLRGRVKRSELLGDRVVIGDSVRLGESDDGSWTLEAVGDRQSAVVRRSLGRRAKVMAANIDRLLVVIAARDPDPHFTALDRLLVIGEGNDIEPVLVINKVDLDGAEQVASDLQALYADIGYRTILTSAVSRIGIDALADVLSTGTSALIGPSGVGKSSLLNTVQPGLELKTGALSRKVQRGRHTTVTSRLIELTGGGRVADTPGFSDIDVWDVPSEELADCFPEIARAGAECRFPDCVHRVEPGCAVRVAVDNGEIARSRYSSYVDLLGVN